MSRSGIIGALIVIGIGLTLRYAVSPSVVTDVDLPTIGAILIVLGLIGGLLALTFAVVDMNRRNKEANAQIATAQAIRNGPPVPPQASHPDTPAPYDDNRWNR